MSDNERSQESLSGFLLARIAEDEEWARWAGAAQDAERSTGLAFVSSLGTSSVTSAGRVLARCEADRRIVEVHAHNARWDDTNIGEWARATLQLLALPYADHPDYDEGWRP